MGGPDWLQNNQESRVLNPVPKAKSGLKVGEAKVAPRRGDGLGPVRKIICRFGGEISPCLWVGT